MSTVTVYSDKQLDLMRKTVAKDCDAAEFDQFIHICKAVNLDPLRRQIYAFVFGKDDPKKRRMSVVTGIDGYRAIAERTRCYRPDDRAPRIEYSEDAKCPAKNPLGIVRCEVTVYKHAHGEWFPTVGEAYWDEFAPIIETGEGGFEWVDTGRTYPDDHKTKAGKPIYRKQVIGDVTEALDPSKPNWRKMPRVMIAKCAEAQAIRRAWPDDFSGLEVEEETDRRMIDITPSEAADQAATDAKLALIGGRDAIVVDWCDGSKLARIPLAEFAEAFLRFAEHKDTTASEIRVVWDRNLPARGEFKAKAGHDYLELQKQIEKSIATKEQSEITQDAAE